MNSRPILKGLDVTEALVIRVPMVAFLSFQRTSRLRHCRWLWQLRLLHPMHFAGLESIFLCKSFWETPRCLPTARQRPNLQPSHLSLCSAPFSPFLLPALALFGSH